MSATASSRNSRAKTASAALSFQAKYDLEYQWDGVVMEISTNGGTTWKPVAKDIANTGSYAWFVPNRPGTTNV